MEKHNFFGYERISTKEERQKQSYVRQSIALDSYALNNVYAIFSNIMAYMKIYTLLNIKCLKSQNTGL